MKKEEVKIGGIYQLASDSMWAIQFGVVGVKVKALSVGNQIEVVYLEGRLKGETKTGYCSDSLVPVLTIKQQVQELVTRTKD